MHLLKKSLVVLLLAAAGPAFGQGTVTSGSASYVLTASHWDQTPEANFTGVGTGDYIFESGWWFRIEGDTRETVFPAPTTQNYTGNTATINWTNMGGRNLDVVKTHVLTSAGAGQGEVVTTLTVTNTSGSTVVLNLFHMVDFDVNGSAGTDSGALVGGDPTYIRFNDTTAGQAEYRAPGSINYMVRPFATTTDVGGQLADTAVTNFDNTGLPATSIDVTSGFQWRVTLGPGSPPRPGAEGVSNSATIRLHQAANVAATPVSLQSFGID